MEKKIFEKRSFWTMCILSLLTFGIYYFYYFVRTTKQLRRAGNNIPTMAYLFLPGIIYGVIETCFKQLGLINEFNILYFGLICLKVATYVSTFYFWYQYIKAYCHTIKYSTDPKYVLKYFLTFVAASFVSLPVIYLMSYTPVTLYIASHPIVAILIIISFLLYGNLCTYLIFQKGFNEYVTQGQILEK